MTSVSVDPEERTVLLNWKKRGDTLILVRLKAEAVLYASNGADAEMIAASVDRSPRTVKGWLTDWNASRLCSVVTGHAVADIKQNRTACLAAKNMDLS